MLKVPAPYPEVGSYALFVDAELPVGEQRAELVRVMRLGVSTAAVAFPLRPGATGNRTVARCDLIDATPLDKAEERELVDLQRYIAGRERPDKAKAARCQSLAERLIMSAVMAIELDKLAANHNRDRHRHGGSRGGIVPAEIAA